MSVSLQIVGDHPTALRYFQLALAELERLKSTYGVINADADSVGGWYFHRTVPVGDGVTITVITSGYVDIVRIVVAPAPEERREAQEEEPIEAVLVEAEEESVEAAFGKRNFISQWPYTGSPYQNLRNLGVVDVRIGNGLSPAVTELHLERLTPNLAFKRTTTPRAQRFEDTWDVVRSNSASDFQKKFMAAAACSLLSLDDTELLVGDSMETTTWGSRSFLLAMGIHTSGGFFGGYPSPTPGYIVVDESTNNGDGTFTANLHVEADPAAAVVASPSILAIETNGDLLASFAWTGSGWQAQGVNEWQFLFNDASQSDHGVLGIFAGPTGDVGGNIVDVNSGRSVPFNNEVRSIGDIYNPGGPYPPGGPYDYNNWFNIDEIHGLTYPPAQPSGVWFANFPSLGLFASYYLIYIGNVVTVDADSSGVQFAGPVGGDAYELIAGSFADNESLIGWGINIMPADSTVYSEESGASYPTSWQALYRRYAIANMPFDYRQYSNPNGFALSGKAWITLHWPKKTNGYGLCIFEVPGDYTTQLEALSGDDRVAYQRDNINVLINNFAPFELLAEIHHIGEYAILDYKG